MNLASLLFGGTLTYWLTIRTRKRSLIEDLFNNAITAVAVADSAQHYICDVAPPRALDSNNYQEMRRQIARTAIENHTRAAGEARAALARVLQYEPAVRPYYVEATAVTNRPDEIISLLVGARDRAVSSRRIIRRRRKGAGEPQWPSREQLLPVAGAIILDQLRSIHEELKELKRQGSAEGGRERMRDTAERIPFGVNSTTLVPSRPATDNLGTAHGEDDDNLKDFEGE